MLIKKIHEYAPSYWERLWDAKASARQTFAKRELIAKLGAYSTGEAVPKNLRRYRGIGCPHQYFKDCLRWSGCMGGSDTQCVQCWDNAWQKEELL